MITVIDNYDSFTFNLVQLFETVSGREARVVRNDEYDVDEILTTATVLVISPGPGVPSRAGKIVETIRRNERIPLLGVCLGHQAIGEAFGGTVVRAPRVMHGKTDRIEHDGSGLFEGCPPALRATRYHSLVIEPSSLPSTLRVDATADDGSIQAVSHRQRPVWGIQFHPESYGTERGERIAENFLKLAGLVSAPSAQIPPPFGRRNDTGEGRRNDTGEGRRVSIGGRHD